ncbi:CusA/CzcA family heavy metal efflux RND transporter [Thiobacillus sp.]|uniref:efflux RND transporter permease subunit n=1 Tax=Thiobacillus sp. TaxID=924 RepID=UPI0017CC60DF|nr:CusA/CzcA family heavy metal efflux RND transporter [Thiobacillus sp.]MBC2730380.1 efflux RND transporter permease subunit [Thiobacillus sp.]MBC2739118.1 efflux RND transporter permease subunit [Thiobacillus sp.]MBC2760597.1 efflux RND transporter permease subunit [Thiobacillus sp.]
MIRRIIEWSLANRLLVLLATLLLATWGVYSAQNIALDAIPDLSDTQVIVKTAYPGQSPQLVEDSVTYSLTSSLLSVPGATAVRGFSMFGESYVYVIFKDGVDPYWARSRVLEYLSQAASRLPAGVTPTLGPDASGTGWIFEYALVDRHHRYDADQLRAVQDFYLKYELQGLPGVAEVASVGGMARQFQIEVDPNRLAAYGISLEQVSRAVRDSNLSGGGSVMEMARAEYMIRAKGYLKTLDDFRTLPLGTDAEGVPIRLQDVAHVQTGPEARRGVTDLDGEGDVTGGIVVMRYGSNALETAARVKARLKELQAGLPPGVELVITYDRSGLIARAIDNLRSKLVEETLMVALVCLLFLFHLRSSLVAALTLPVGILAAFIVMKQQGVSANIMSLGGIAIAIGAMVDAAIVMIENMHKHLERAGPGSDYWAVARASSVEVGPALFFSLLIITVSFLPVFALSGQEGKLFAPLAYTKTYAMAASAALAVTLIPVLMGYFIRGRIVHERSNPLNRVLQALYRPALLASLNHPKRVLLLAVLLLASAAWPVSRLGSEFMPPLYEGDLLYMPTTLPGVSVDEAANILQITDRLIRQMPEVARVFGKAGRADSATDPAPLSMLETTILLKPRNEWPPGETVEELIQKLDRAVRLPGLTNSWGYPIRTRIDMLSTGIRTAVGIKITGPDLAGIAALAETLETTLKKIPGTRAVFGERVTGGRYLDIDIDRAQAARYGVTVAAVQRLVQSAIGGENIGTVVDGRERFSINLRYPRALRDSMETLAESRIATPSGIQVPLGTVARLRIADGPAEIKSENGRLTGYVYLDIEGRDLGGYVEAARQAVDTQVKLPPGYAIAWSGQYANLQHARQKMLWLIPFTVLLILLLLYLHFREPGKVVLVAVCLPFSLVGGFWLVYWLGYNLSVAVGVGFIALAGVAAEFGVVMLLYIDKAVEESRQLGCQSVDRVVLRQAIVQGALMRVRPKMMTVAVIVAGLLPVMFSDGAGSEAMKRIAAPLVGGMLTAPLLSLFVIPALYWSWQGRGAHYQTGND